MARANIQELEAWVADWLVGSKGTWGSRLKIHFSVVEVLWERGLPTLRLQEDGTGMTYYCKYGSRQHLIHR